MAKKGKVKKGVGSYLFVLFLAIIATFLVIITVMLFSPFKNILGFKYFAYKEDEYVLSATNADGNETINFETIENLNIDCSFANVLVERSTKVDTYGFRFENYLSGFARSDHDTDFSYEVYYTDSTKKELNVELHEPEGFLYFNRNITITVLISTKVTYNLDNTNLNITNTKGNIYLGNQDKVWKVIGEEVKNYVTFGTVNLKTNTGKTIIFPYAIGTFDNLYIKTEKGKIESRIDVGVTGECEIYAEKAKINFKKLIAGTTDKPAKFDLGNSKFYAKDVVANIELNIKDGYLDIDKLMGFLSSNDAIDQMAKATITIKEFDGFLSLPYVNNSKVNLGKVSGTSQIYVRSTGGNINIKKSEAYYVNIETTSGNVNVYSSGMDVDVTTVSGNINVTFDNDVMLNELDLASKSGAIKLKVKPDFAFNLYIYNAKGDARTKNVNVEWLDALPANELQVNGGSLMSKVYIFTNGSITVGTI